MRTKQSAAYKQLYRKRFRHEYKYRIDALQSEILQIRAAGVMQRDAHVRADGTYLIRSAYFDDSHDTCLTENLMGTDPRSKFRIRYYNGDTGRISLEKKSKVRGMCIKEACRISAEECETFLRGDVPAFDDSAPEVKKRLFAEVRVRGLYPKVIVTYERVPFTYVGGNVRVTFDRHITSSNDLTHFLTGDYAQRPILPCGETVLEVKWDQLLPKHIKEILQLEKLNWTAFSKYYLCRMFHL